MKNFWKLRLPDGTIREGSGDCLTEGLSLPGFVISSFDNAPGSLLCIPDHAPAEAVDISALPPLYPEPEESTSRKRHEENVVKAAAFHARNGGKTVISRVLRTAPVSDPQKVFSRLCDLYPEACVFLFSTVPSGTWAGASPELLLEAKGRVLRTMSLAGTRPAGTAEPWDEKNLHEQEIVTHFILDTLRSHGIEASQLPMETRIAGNIEHILTQIEGVVPKEWSEEALAALLADLSPTPALGGFPRAEAMQLISKLEEHERGYYGGYFGYIASPTDFRLNVNLRSVLLTPEAACIFAGGGITGASVAEEEWEETCRKANTVAMALI